MHDTNINYKKIGVAKLIPDKGFQSMHKKYREIYKNFHKHKRGNIRERYKCYMCNC